MARIAESSVVVALRDFQWKIAESENRNPDLFLSLSGNTDKKLGDVKFGLGETFLLIEAKSTSATIKQEWDRGKKRGRKHAHLKTRLIIEGISTKNENYEKLLDQSLSAHHFFYHIYDSGKHFIAAEPYILGTSRRGGYAEHPLNAEPGINPRTETERKRLIKGLENVSEFEIVENATQLRVEYTTMQNIYGDAIKISRKSQLGWPLSMGLPLSEFQEYVDYLCDGTDEDIESLITTRSGLLLLFSGKTSQLHQLVRRFKSHEMTNSLETGLELHKKKRNNDPT